MGKRVLLADDSATIQKLTEIALSDSDFELLAVSDGKQAVDQLESFRPDIVLVDAIMPVMDGYEVCQFMKNDERFKHVPVILLRNRWQPYDEDRASAASVDREILKPYSQDQLMEMMNEFFPPGGSGPDPEEEPQAPSIGMDSGLDFDEPLAEPEPMPAIGEPLGTESGLDGHTVKYNPADLENMVKRQSPGLGREDDALSLDSPIPEEAEKASADVENLEKENPFPDLGEEESGDTLELTTEYLEDTGPGDEEDLLGSDTDPLEIEDLDGDNLTEIDDDLTEELPAPGASLREESADVLADDDYEVVDDGEEGMEEPILLEGDDTPDISGWESLSEETDPLEDTGEVTEPVSVGEESPEPVASAAQFGENEAVTALSEDDLELDLEDTDELGLDASSTDSDDDSDEDVLSIDEIPDTDTPEDVLSIDEIPDTDTSEDVLGIDEIPDTDTSPPEDFSQAESFEYEEQEPLGEDFQDEPLTMEDDLLEEVIEQDTEPVGASVLEDENIEPIGAPLEDVEEITEPIETPARIMDEEASEHDEAPLSMEEVDASEMPTEIIDEPVLEELDDELDMEAIDEEFTTGPVTVDDDEDPVILDLPEETPVSETPVPEPAVTASDAAPVSIIQREVVAEQLNLSEDQLEKLADRVAERLIHKIGSDSVREIIWDIVPELAEAMIKKRIYQLEQAVDED